MHGEPEDIDQALTDARRRRALQVQAHKSNYGDERQRGGEANRHLATSVTMMAAKRATLMAYWSIGLDGFHERDQSFSVPLAHRSECFTRGLRFAAVPKNRFGDIAGAAVVQQAGVAIYFRGQT